MSEQDQPVTQEVSSVVTGDAVRHVADRALLRAYRMRAASNGTMHLTRPQGRYKGTIKGWNELSGDTCKTWADVLVSVRRMLGEGESR